MELKQLKAAKQISNNNTLPKKEGAARADCSVMIISL